MELTPARFKRGRWWVNIPKPTGFKTQPEATKALVAYRDEHGCLYHAFTRIGTDDLDLGRGFRFCDEHARHAKKILNTQRMT